MGFKKSVNWTHIVGCSLLFGLSLCMAVSAEEEVHVASFNVHYIVPNSPKEDWPERRDAVRDVIADMDADIIGFQEMETFTGGNYNGTNIQLDWVLSHFPKYKVGAYGDPAVFPITQPILYDQNKFTLLDQGFLFFSETPSVIYSRQWNGSYPYFATWVELITNENENENEKRFLVVNLHNDFKSRSNRLASSEVVTRYLSDRLQQLPSIVLGDFNAPSSFKEVTQFADFGLQPVAPSGSTNRIFGLRILPAIDHILITDDFAPQGDIMRWKDKYNGVYPSDHVPISARLLWQ